MLNKTIIEQLTNTYIDCTYTTKSNTIVVNIETPSPNGDDIRLPFTIRTKDGYSLKYDDTSGYVKFRINTKYLKDTTTEQELLTNYNLYFSDYTFDLKSLATYENTDPVINFIAPYKKIPYDDIESQKENIYIFNTGIQNRAKRTVFIVSYYGKDPNKCKLELFQDVPPDELGEPPHMIKTASGKMFKRLEQTVSYGGDELGSGAINIPPVVTISAKAEKVGEVIEEDTTDGLFTTYIVSQNDLKNIKDKGKIDSEIIINTFSYPIKFDSNDLLETNIVLGNTPLEDTKGLRFKIAEPKIKIFSFNVPYLKDVESCKLLLPFNPEITLDYDIIRGKVISGYIQYEISTNSSTLYIDNGDVEFYKDNIVIETSVPYKPTGEYNNFKETEKRLGKQVPNLLIKCLQEEKQQNFIQGKIEYPITGILKDELDLLNDELEKGVITNE